MAGAPKSAGAAAVHDGVMRRLRALRARAMALQAELDQQPVVSLRDLRAGARHARGVRGRAPDA
jgi:hypothetical protein